MYRALHSRWAAAWWRRSKRAGPATANSCWKMGQANALCCACRQGRRSQKSAGSLSGCGSLTQWGCRCPRAVAFGCREDAVYQLLGWVEGCDLRQTLPALPEDEQYRLGVQASRVLRKIHTLPLRPSEGIEREEQQQKLLSRLDQYEQGQLRLPGDERPLRFAREQVGLVGQRPPVWCHRGFPRGQPDLYPAGGSGGHRL